jgi:CMP-N-acetylneuraminic acid synthetase
MGKKPYVVEVEERESIDIDNIEDWEKAEKYL